MKKIDFFLVSVKEDMMKISLLLRKMFQNKFFIKKIVSFVRFLFSNFCIKTISTTGLKNKNEKSKKIDDFYRK